MMVGNVFNRHVLLPVPLRLPNQPEFTIEFVIDTGFTGFLALPRAAVTAMALPFLHRITANLADGSIVDVTVHSVSILWHGEEREARVLAMGDRPLLGTSLLDGYELVAQFAEGGLVTVDAL